MLWHDNLPPLPGENARDVRLPTLEPTDPDYDPQAALDAAIQQTVTKALER